MSERVGIGYIGAGDHLQTSHEPFIDLHLGQVMAVADINTERAQDVAQTQPGEALVYSDYRELLENPDVDAVMIATGDAHHYAMAKAAIEAGKHVLVEKPAAANLKELARLPKLFDLAEQQGLQLWVCHPREFDEDGPWSTAAHMLGNPQDISERFDVGPMGQLRAIDYGSLYTAPTKTGLHESFAADKLNHNIVSVFQALPDVTGFRHAQLLEDGPTTYEARFMTVSAENPAQNDIVIRSHGARSAQKERHGKGIYRDWIEATFDEGTLRLEPSLGRMAITYGLREEIMTFDTANLYKGMFGRFNTAFLESIRNPDSNGSMLTRRAMILGTGAALLMQGGFRTINEEVLSRLPFSEN